MYSIKYFWVPGKLNIVIMEMIMIEKRVYDSMVAKLEALAGRIEALNENNKNAWAIGSTMRRSAKC